MRVVYLVQDIPAFVMYCVYGESRSSLLIESTDSMIYIVFSVHVVIKFQGGNMSGGISRGPPSV